MEQQSTSSETNIAVKSSENSKSIEKDETETCNKKPKRRFSFKGNKEVKDSKKKDKEDTNNKNESAENKKVENEVKISNGFEKEEKDLTSETFRKINSLEKYKKTKGNETEINCNSTVEEKENGKNIQEIETNSSNIEVKNLQEGNSNKNEVKMDKDEKTDSRNEEEVVLRRNLKAQGSERMSYLMKTKGNLYLRKKVHFCKWRLYYAVLDDLKMQMNFFKSEEDYESLSDYCKVCVDLRFIADVIPQKPSLFQTNFPFKMVRRAGLSTVKLAAVSEDDRAKWITTIEAIVRKIKMASDLAFLVEGQRMSSTLPNKLKNDRSDSTSDSDDNRSASFRGELVKPRKVSRVCSFKVDSSQISGVRLKRISSNKEKDDACQINEGFIEEDKVEEADEFSPIKKFGVNLRKINIEKLPPRGEREKSPEYQELEYKFNTLSLVRKSNRSPKLPLNSNVRKNDYRENVVKNEKGLKQLNPEKEMKRENGMKQLKPEIKVKSEIQSFERTQSKREEKVKKPPSPNLPISKSVELVIKNKTDDEKVSIIKDDENVELKVHHATSTIITFDDSDSLVETNAIPDSPTNGKNVIPTNEIANPNFLSNEFTSTTTNAKSNEIAESTENDVTTSKVMNPTYEIINSNSEEKMNDMISAIGEQNFSYRRENSEPNLPNSKEIKYPKVPEKPKFTKTKSLNEDFETLPKEYVKIFNEDKEIKNTEQNPNKTGELNINEVKVKPDLLAEIPENKGSKVFENQVSNVVETEESKSNTVYKNKESIIITQNEVSKVYNDAESKSDNDYKSQKSNFHEEVIIASHKNRETEIKKSNIDETKNFKAEVPPSENKINDFEISNIGIADQNSTLIKMKNSKNVVADAELHSAVYDIEIKEIKNCDSLIVTSEISAEDTFSPNDAMNSEGEYLKSVNVPKEERYISETSLKPQNILKTEANNSEDSFEDKMKLKEMSEVNADSKNTSNAIIFINSETLPNVIYLKDLSKVDINSESIPECTTAKNASEVSLNPYNTAEGNNLKDSSEVNANSENISKINSENDQAEAASCCEVVKSISEETLKSQDVPKEINSNIISTISLNPEIVVKDFNFDEEKTEGTLKKKCSSNLKNTLEILTSETALNILSDNTVCSENILDVDLNVKNLSNVFSDSTENTRDLKQKDLGDSKIRLLSQSQIESILSNNDKANFEHSVREKQSSSLIPYDSKINQELRFSIQSFHSQTSTESDEPLPKLNFLGKQEKYVPTIDKEDVSLQNSTKLPGSESSIKDVHSN